ncbi:hypothetical protein D5086_000631 [Populus alba]|uniref:Uncharacterized protein n=1 Tax=Populus alba TaxID=43335 RepID=A0ACC4CWG1_POPAL
MMLALCHGAAFFLEYVSCSWVALESEMLQNQLGCHGTSLRNTIPAVKEHFVPAGSEFIIPEEIPHQFSGDTFEKTVLGQRADGPN